MEGVMGFLLMTSVLKISLYLFRLIDMFNKANFYNSIVPMTLMAKHLKKKPILWLFVIGLLKFSPMEPLELKDDLGCYFFSTFFGQYPWWFLLEENRSSAEGYWFKTRIQKCLFLYTPYFYSIPKWTIQTYHQS